MTNQLPTGAYVIRNKQTSTVLHIENSNLTKKWCNVIAAQQDENVYREQQLWWVEPLPGSEPGGNSKGGIIYSITNTCSGKSLDLNPEQEKGKRKERSKNEWPLTAHRSNEAPWQKWRIETIPNKKDEICYKIVSVWNGDVVDIKGNPADVGAKCHATKFSPGNDQHCWEFVVPVIAFPPGWFQIRNVTTGDFLNHNYLCDPPVLVKPSHHQLPSQYRETWGTQWSLTHAGSLSSGFKSPTGKNTWCITNRLTGGFLGNMYNTVHPFNGVRKVNAYRWHFNLEDTIEHIWKLEIDSGRSSRWKITHYSTGFFLERTTNLHYNGTEVICRDKKFPEGNENKTWFLTSPVIETPEELIQGVRTEISRRHQNIKAPIKSILKPTGYSSELL